MQARFDSWRIKVNADSDTDAATIVPPELLPSLGAAVDTAYAALKGRVTPDELADVLGRLAIACRGQGGEDGRATTAKAALYMQYLGDYPGDVIALAADEWIRGNIWFPAISELRAICDRIQGDRTRVWNRLRRAYQASHQAEERRLREEQITRDLMDPEKQAMVEAALADAKAKLLRPAPPPRPRIVPRHVEFTEAERERALSAMKARA